MIQVILTDGRKLVYEDPTQIEFTENVFSIYFKNGSTHLPKDSIKTILETENKSGYTIDYIIYSGVEPITSWADLTKKYNGTKIWKHHPILR